MALLACLCHYGHLFNGLTNRCLRELVAGVMGDVVPLKRTALLVCMVHVARTRARDDLAEMFCKRMASITKLAKAELARSGSAKRRCPSG